MPSNKKTLVILSGSGVSAESGLATFRDSGGLWEGYDINEVATLDGWYKSPSKVLDFYNKRREQAVQAKPNQAHECIAQLEKLFNVHIVTQNVDNLHEKAGSTNVLHLHGELTKARSIKNENLVIEIGSSPIHLGDVGEDGEQLRPHIVWFGEMVPMLQQASDVVTKADILVVVGTSLVVYPAAGLVNYAKEGIPKFIVDPSMPELQSFEGWEHFKEPATTGIEKLKIHLEKNYV